MQISNAFLEDEKLYRAIFLPPGFTWTKDGRFTSAVFKNKNGISVDREYGRTVNDVITKMQSVHSKPLQALAVVSVKECLQCEGLTVVYDPTPINEFHSQIHRLDPDGSNKYLPLTPKQSKHLANIANRIDIET